MSTTNAKWLASTTYVEVNEVHFRWVICDVKTLLKDLNKPIDSTVFNSSRYVDWYCQIIPISDGSSTLALCNNNPCSAIHDWIEDVLIRQSCEFEFACILPNGEVNLAGPFFHIFTEDNYKYKVLITGTKMLEYISEPEGTLTIVCRLRETITKETSNDDDTLLIPACTMQRDLETILKDQQFTDVTLVVEGHSIKAHKAILAARSPVFAAEFSTDMEESRQNQVPLTGMKYDVAQKLLLFIYTGKTDIGSEAVDQLLLAAEDYGLMQLKAQCEQTILNTLTIPTAIKTLMFAERANAENLKSRAIKFIKTHMGKVVESADWKTLADDHQELIIDLCRALPNA